jgi:hypothetical protein
LSQRRKSCSIFSWAYVPLPGNSVIELMRTCFLVILCLVWSFLGLAQVSIPSSHLPRVGDTVTQGTDNLPGTVRNLSSGRNQRWDLTVLEAPFLRQAIWKPASKGTYPQAFRNATLCVQSDPLTESYYRTEAGSLILVGSIGPDPLNISRKALQYFSGGLIERKFPMRYGEGFSTDTKVVLLYGESEIPSWLRKKLPLSPDSIKLTIEYDRYFYADGYGKLVSPGGFFDVLRQKMTQTLDFELEAKVGRRRWQNITRAVKDKQLLRRQQQISYSFYSPEEKEPVVRLWMSDNERKVARADFFNNEPQQKVQNEGSVKPDLYASPNPAIASVRFEFLNLPSGTYTLSIFNILGQREWQKQYQINGNFTEKVDITSFKKGTYLYSLKDETGRTISAKKLMVIRP